MLFKKKKKKHPFSPNPFEHNTRLAFDLQTRNEEGALLCGDAESLRGPPGDFRGLFAHKTTANLPLVFPLKL